MKTTAPRISCAVLLIIVAILSLFGVPASAKTPTVWIQIEFCTKRPNTELELRLPDGSCRSLQTDEKGSADALLFSSEYVAICGGDTLKFELQRDGTVRILRGNGETVANRIFFGAAEG